MRLLPASPLLAVALATFTLPACGQPAKEPEKAGVNVTTLPATLVIL